MWSSNTPPCKALVLLGGWSGTRGTHASIQVSPRVPYTQKADFQPKLLISSGEVTRATMLPIWPAEYARPRERDLLLTGTQLQSQITSASEFRRPEDRNASGQNAAYYDRGLIV